MNKSFAVSVIIPNFNHAPFLKERIDSVLAQEAVEFEVILLDDFSSDESKQIIESYQEHPLVSHILINKVNSGSTFRQWQKGISLAKHELVWIAESDDLADIDFLKTAIEAFQQDQNLSLHYCQSDVIDDRDQFVKSNKWWTDDLDERKWSTDFHMNGREFVEAYLSQKNVIPNASAVVFKKENTLDTLKDIEDFKMCGDWLFWSMLLKSGNLHFRAKNLNKFRVLIQSTRNHNTLEKKRLRLTEEASVLKELNSEFHFSDALRREQEDSLVKRWIDIHKDSRKIKKGFFSILNTDFIRISKLKLTKLKLFP